MQIINPDKETNDILSEEEFRPKLAPKHARIFAACLDYCIFFILLGIFYGEWYKPDTEGVGIGFNLINPNPIVLVLLWFLIFPFLEGLKGQTIGKRLLRVRVLSNDYLTASYVQCIVRHLCDTMDWLPFFGIAGLIVASNNKLKQRIGDLVAKTIVIDSSYFKLVSQEFPRAID